MQENAPGLFFFFFYILLIISILQEVLDKKKPAEDMKDANEDEEIKDAQEYKEQKALATTQQKPLTGMAGKQEEDLTLRAALYGVLFQSYADKVYIF